MRLRWYDHEVTVRYPALLEFGEVGRWKVWVRPFVWRRARGDWPAHWRDNDPPWPGPIFRYWQLGPIDIWRFRETPRRGS